MAYVPWNHCFRRADPPNYHTSCHTKATLISQLHAFCDCGAKLVHQECTGKVIAILYRFRGGVYYEHTDGHHAHARPTHLTKSQCARFESIAAANPHARTAELYTGIAGQTGPQPSVAEISSVLYNVGRIKAELWHIKENSSGEFADDFVNFQNAHAGFVGDAGYDEKELEVCFPPSETSLVNNRCSAGQISATATV
ncbi:hypothetical protein DFH29DRAFT_891311 [Suillus ampliporus]|nr:hypothetical protein DFH29DRAFT_891311 [Suillus ampliporus]